MDILTTKYDPLASGDRPMGRNTEDTMRLAPHWMQMIPPAPHIFSGAGEATQVSPPIYHYCIGGYDNQTIGCCVGKGTKNAAGTLLRIPAGAVYDPDDESKCTPPGPNVRLSGLFCYYNARNVHGWAGFGEGAVVAYSLDAVMKYGFIPESLWPDTAANQSRYSDRKPPSKEDYAEGAKHIVIHAARITSAQQYLDYLAQGIPVVDGIAIGRGFMSTADDGQFSLRGITVGGHSTVTVGYDKRKNRLYKRNSWFQWGRRTSNPEFNSSDPAFGGNAGGHDNIGWCALDEYMRYYLNDSKLASGATDAFVMSDVPGFTTPKIKPKSARELL